MFMEWFLRALVVVGVITVALDLVFNFIPASWDEKDKKDKK